MEIFWNIVIALISGITAALLTKKLDIDYERLKTCNKIIYELLGIYTWLYVFLRKSNMTHNLINEISKKTVTNLSEKQFKPVEVLLKTNAIKSLNYLVTNKIIWDELATIDPVGALDLKGIADGLDATLNLDKQLKNAEPSLNKKIEDAIDNLANVVQDYILKELLPKLRKEIVKISNISTSKKAIREKLSELENVNILKS